MNRPSNARSIVAWSTFGFAIATALAAAVLWRLNAESADGVFPPQIFVVPGFGLVGAIVPPGVGTRSARSSWGSRSPALAPPSRSGTPCVHSEPHPDRCL